MDGKVRDTKPCLCYAYLTISGVVHTNMNLKVDLAHDNAKNLLKNHKNGNILIYKGKLW